MGDTQLISYDDAVAHLVSVAAARPAMQERRPWQRGNVRHASVPRANAKTRTVLLMDAVGKRCTQPFYAPHSTPQHDTSAMDGFAVCSSFTSSASAENPVVFRIVGSMAAGDSQKPKPTTCASMIQTEPLNTCVEIMTGARFPEVAHPHLDSVVKVEDVVVSEHWSASDSSVSRYIEIVRPVKSSQHRRPAGSDFQAGDRIIEGKAVIVPKHVAALASLGFTEIEVVNEDPESRSQPSRQRRDMALRIGVLSTGSEVRADASRQASDTSKQAIPDSNGPYLVSTLRRCCPDAEVEYLGVASDSTAELARKLDQAVLQGQFDVVITSGGVSKGRHDLVRYVVETVLSGEVIFHGVKIRPGAPVLFALLCGGNSTRPSNTHRTAFFGAPGNPLAAAVALRFFVMPYLQHLNSSDGGHRPQLVSYTGKMAVVSSRRDTPTPSLARLKPTDSTCFWLAKHRANKVGSVEIVDDQASYKLRGLLEADCWVTASAGQSEVFIGQSLPMCAL